MDKHKAWATTIVAPESVGSSTTKGQMNTTFRVSLTASQAGVRLRRPVILDTQSAPLNQPQPTPPFRVQGLRPSSVFLVTAKWSWRNLPTGGSLAADPQAFGRLRGSGSGRRPSGHRGPGHHGSDGNGISTAADAAAQADRLQQHAAVRASLACSGRGASPRGRGASGSLAAPRTSRPSIFILGA